LQAKQDQISELEKELTNKEIQKKDLEKEIKITTTYPELTSTIKKAKKNLVDKDHK